jgi:hypothetical protein
VIFLWSQYQPITMRTTMYTHGTGREESTRVRVTGRAHAGCEVGRTRDAGAAIVLEKARRLLGGMGGNLTLWSTVVDPASRIVHATLY